jgi:hypothetical protein
MSFTLILCLKPSHCCSQNHWWLVQEPYSLEALILYRLTEVVLEHTTLPIALASRQEFQTRTRKPFAHDLSL